MPKTKISNPFRPIYPSPAGLIVALDENKKPNVMTAGEVFNISLKNPCIVGLALRKATYTHGLICESKEFTVNLPSTAILSQVDLVGSISGRHGLDKFKAYGLTPIDSDMITTPIIEECPVNLECKLCSVSEVGDHDLFLGEVVMMHVDSDKLNGKGSIEINKVNAFSFAEWGYYKFGEKLEAIGFARRKIKEEDQAD